MMTSLKSELRKLFTVRATYALSGFVFAMVIFFAFYIEGFRVTPEALADPGRLASETISAITVVAGLFAFVGLLLMTHEYRYNTIMYTLTASKSRTRTLLAKIIVVSFYALLMSVIVGVASPVLTYFGVQLKGHEFVHQVIPVGDLLWRTLFYGWGYSMIALILATIIRSQVGAIVTVFLAPITLEPLLSLLLKSNTVYLPFSALSQVIASSNPDQQNGFNVGHLSPSKGALVFGIYLIIGWIVAWILFLKRDAN